MSNQLISFLQLYKVIPEKDQELISSAFDYKKFQEGSYLFEGMKLCRELFFICNGVLRIVMHNKEGRELTHYFLKEYQFCTILNSFTNEVPAPESIQAACDAEVLVISKARLFALYEQLPYLKVLIDEILQQSMIEKIQLRNAYLGLDSTARYQEFLKRQADVAVRVSLNDIAAYLGITPQSLSRIRKNIR